MAAQLQITVRDMPHSEALDSRIRQKVAALERLYDRMTACHVTVEAPHHHHLRGVHYCVKLELALPGGGIVVNRDHAKDAYIALRDAFMAARRQLIEHAERGQGAGKARRSRRQRAVAEVPGND